MSTTTAEQAKMTSMQRWHNNYPVATIDSLTLRLDNGNEGECDVLGISRADEGNNVSAVLNGTKYHDTSIESSEVMDVAKALAADCKHLGDNGLSEDEAGDAIAAMLHQVCQTAQCDPSELSLEHVMGVFDERIEELVAEHPDDHSSKDGRVDWVLDQLVEDFALDGHTSWAQVLVERACEVFDADNPDAYSNGDGEEDEDEEDEDEETEGEEDDDEDLTEADAPVGRAKLFPADAQRVALKLCPDGWRDLEVRMDQYARFTIVGLKGGQTKRRVDELDDVIRILVEETGIDGRLQSMIRSVFGAAIGFA